MRESRCSLSTSAWLAGLLVLETAGAAGGQAGLETWPATYRWHSFYGSSQPDYSTALAVDPAGRATLVGMSYAAWNGPGGRAPRRAFTEGSVPNAAVVQTDADGAYLWHAFYPCELAGATADAAGNLYLTGDSRKSWTGPAGQAPLHAHPGGAGAIVVLKLAQDGSYLWHTFYGSGHPNYFSGGQGVAGDVLVTGTSAGNGWTGPAGQAPRAPFAGLQDAFVLKLDASGAYQWHTFFGTGSDEGTAVAVVGPSAYVLGSSAASWSGPGAVPPLNPYHGDALHPTDLFVVKLHVTDGTYQWHTFYGAGSDYPAGVAASDDGVYVAARSAASWNGPAGQQPLGPYQGTASRSIVTLVLKLTAAGAYAWHGFYGVSAYANGIATDGMTVYVVGDSTLTWTGPAGEPPVHPISHFAAYALLALRSGGAYLGHDFLGNATAADSVLVRNGALYVGGGGGQPWLGPGGEPPRNSPAGSSELLVVRLVAESPAVVLSDEREHLIGAMVAAGHGALSLRDAVAWIRTNSSPDARQVISGGFMSALATCAPTSAVATTRLDAVTPGAAVAVAADCTARTVPVSGWGVLGVPGSVTSPFTLSGVGRFEVTSATGESPLASWQVDGTTYNAFAVAWSVRHGALRRTIPPRRP